MAIAEKVVSVAAIIAADYLLNLRGDSTFYYIMILTSKLCSEKWIWIKIPKTGTRAYSKLLFPNGTDENLIEGNRFYHMHFSFHYLYNHHQRQYSGFTVVRHPLSRFISALNHLAELNEECVEVNCINHPGNLPLDDINKLTEFIYDNFDKNCIAKNNRSFKEIFSVDFTNFYDSFFKTQVHWAYHPKMKWFHYENLSIFNAWLEQTFHVDCNNLERIGTPKKKHLEHLDFKNPKFIKAVEYLFHADYESFGYHINT